jgi:L-galactose dehydrogenase
MNYRPFGSTGIDVSVLGFGASPLGDVFGETSTSERERAVGAAIDLGINLFDVSPYYGATLAEQRLGELLVGKRNRVILATKCGRNGFDQFDFSASGIRASCEASLVRLRTDCVDLLQAHDVEFARPEQIINETIPTLRELQAEGKTRFIGITGLKPELLRAIAEQQPVDSFLSYCRFNLLNQDMDAELTPFAREHRVGLINASPLHMGILTEAGPPSWHPAAREAKDAGAEIVRLCAARGVSVTDIALQYCLRHPVVSSTLVGHGRLSEVEQNVRAAGQPLDQDLLEEIEAVAVVPQNSWPNDNFQTVPLAEGTTGLTSAK